MGLPLWIVTDVIFEQDSQVAIDAVEQDDEVTLSSVTRHDEPGVVGASSSSERRKNDQTFSRTDSAINSYATTRFIPIANTRSTMLNSRISTRRLPFSNRSMRFHLAHTSDESDIGSLQWHCMESIFYHHPNAKVILHVKNMTAAPFQYLIDAGYDLQVQKYSLVDLLHRLKDAKVVPDDMVNGFLERLPTYIAGEHWTVAETDVLRLLNLRLYGGIYLGKWRRH